MKWILGFAALSFLWWDVRPVQAMESLEAHALAESLVRSFNQGDFEALRDQFAPEAKIYFMGEGESTAENVDALIQKWQEARDRIPDARFGLRRVFGTERGLIAEYVFWGRMPEETQGAKASARAGILFIEVEDNKIQSLRDYTNPDIFHKLAEGLYAGYGSVTPEWPVDVEIVGAARDAETRDIAVQYYEAHARRDLNQMRELLADDVVIEHQAMSIRYEGKDVFEARWQMEAEEMPGRKAVVEDMFIQDGYAVMRLFSYNDEISLHTVEILRIENGKIQSVTEYFNQRELPAERTPEPNPGS